MKRFFIGLGKVVLALVLLLVVLIAYQVFAFNRSASAVSDLQPLDMVVASPDSTVLARGEHLASSFGGCWGCHGTDLGGQLVEELGPIGTIIAPNLTAGAGGVGRDYSDGELARAIRHGIGRDGQSLLFMPSEEHNWWPDEDLLAIVSYVRSVPPVAKNLDPTTVGALGKLLSQFGMMELLSAHAAEANDRDPPPAPEPTARYGEYLAISCKGCHGAGLGGGKIPGAPAELATPANLTPHETGLGNWSRDDFDHMINTGTRPDGRTLDSFMPIEPLAALNETEKSALWAYLQSLEALEFGSR